VIARRRCPVCAPLAALTVLAASVLASVVKDEFERSRPYYTDYDIEPLVDTPGSSSFPAAHALTAFAAATIISAYEPRLRWPAFGLAVAVGFSRIYLGVHFWLDVLVGAGLGIVLGYAAARVAKDVGRRLRPASTQPA
jgi:undecaprenyl-diphosphatase